ncbi:hypothetical protein BB561_000980 [Smittium simulii]|uniref:Uncharacterized protein n=1 Tax=Smittium simulii TaxID=133385 RepID=A0A2T9YWS0_9FUNG|nr:hypothetical protein BB561_000980 [Smittium simulii]
MFYANTQANYPPELIEQARISAIRNVNRRFNYLILAYTFLAGTFIAFGVIACIRYVKFRGYSYFLISAIMSGCFLLYTIYCIAFVIREKNAKISWFKRPTTDPYFIVNGIYPNNDITITTFQQTQPYAYNNTNIQSRPY